MISGTTAPVKSLPILFEPMPTKGSNRIKIWSWNCSCQNEPPANQTLIQCMQPAREGKSPKRISTQSIPDRYNTFSTQVVSVPILNDDQPIATGTESGTLSPLPFSELVTLWNRLEPDQAEKVLRLARKLAESNRGIDERGNGLPLLLLLQGTGRPLSSNEDKSNQSQIIILQWSQFFLRKMCHTSS